MKVEPRRGSCLWKWKVRFEETGTPSNDSWWSVDTHVELLDGRSATLVGSNHLDLHDLDGVGTCTVAGAHITIWQKNMVWKPPIVRMGHLCVPKPSVNVWGVLTALCDSSRGGQVSVLSVHVVSSTTRIIAQPDTKVLYLQGCLLMDLNQATAADL